MCNISSMSTKEKKRLINDIIHEYKSAKAKYEVLISHDFYPHVEFSVVRDSHMRYNNVEVKMIDYMEEKETQLGIITYFEAILEQLSPCNREVIIKDFVERERGWWEDTYSKSTYYRLRRSAIDEFLDFIVR